jgi:hypothetical protein
MIATRKSKFAPVVAIGTVLVGGGGTAAVASTRSSTPAGGTVHLFVNINVKSQTVDPTLLTGAIGDYGTSTSETKTGKADPNGNFEKVKLTKGTFIANVTVLNAAGNSAGTFNAATCSAYFSVTRPVPLSKGTGLYKNITGTLKITEIGGLLFPRNANGTCNAGPNTQPLKFGGSVVGVGKVKF